MLHIVDTAIKFGVFPVKLKTTKITPVFRSAEQEVMMNYTPISVLP